jgi:hypothetical protein
MTVADSRGGHRRPFGAALPYPTLCGHPEAWNGHCAFEGSGIPQAAVQAAHDAAFDGPPDLDDVREMLEAAAPYMVAGWLPPCANRWQLCEWPQCQPPAQVPLCVPGGAAGEVSAPGGSKP